MRIKTIDIQSIQSKNLNVKRKLTNKKILSIITVVKNYCNDTNIILQEIRTKET